VRAFLLLFVHHQEVFPREVDIATSTEGNILI